MIDWQTLWAFVGIDLCINALLIPPAALFGDWYLTRKLQRMGVIKPERIGQDMSQFEEE